MQRTYRASTGIYIYAALLGIDALVLGLEAARRLPGEAPISGVFLLVVAVICLGLALLLILRWGRLRITVTPEAMLISGDGPDRRIYWSDVEQVREIRGPPYQLSLRRLLPGPYLPHTLLRGETILEIVARPATRVLLRRALVGGFGSLHEDVLSHVPKEAALDLHVRWWRD